MRLQAIAPSSAGTSPPAKRWAVMPAQSAKHRLTRIWRLGRMHARRLARKVQPLRRYLRGLNWGTIGCWTGATVGGLVVVLMLTLTFLDWNTMRGPISAFASNATGRTIAIRGDLDVELWRLNPRVRVEGLSIGSPARLRARGGFAEIAEADMTLRWAPLLIGRLEIVRLALNGAQISLYRDRDGVSNWRQSSDRRRSLDLPAIRHFSIVGGRVVLEDDKRDLVLRADFTTHEDQAGADEGQFSLIGEGAINNEPFALELRGAPLINVRRDRAYPFEIMVEAGRTRIEARGAVARPFNFAAWHAQIRASGDDLAQLYALIGLALPNTPPYDLAGRVERRGASYAMSDLAGRVGDSDLNGRFVATRRSDGRLALNGAFRSNVLDFDDLLTVLGAPPSIEETASPEQRALAAALAAQGRVLPDADLDISRVRNMDARVSFRAARVRSERFPLRGLSIDVDLERGVLRLDPLVLELRQGRLAGAVQIDARAAVPRTELDLRLAQARMETIMATRGSPPLVGGLVGRVQLSGAGASVRETAANADGMITLVTPDGEMREALAELTGINVARGLGLLLSDDHSRVAIRCGVASFEVRRGLGRARTILFDTETMVIRGEGGFSLRDESLDLRLEGEAKEPRLISIDAPITIDGRWRSPRVGVDAEDATPQGGVAAALASLVAPIAGLLPFVDLGLAEDVNCAGLLASGRPAPQQ